MQPYHEYVNHMLKCYFRDFAPEQTNSQTVAINRAVCDKILRGLGQGEVEILRGVYSGQGEFDIKRAVRDFARDKPVSERDVWRLIRTVSRKIARERGLI